MFPSVLVNAYLGAALKYLIDTKIRPLGRKLKIH
jgi:hypothetical protein